MAMIDAPETLSARLAAELRGQVLVPAPIKALLLEMAQRVEAAEANTRLMVLKAFENQLTTTTTEEEKAWPLPKA